MAIDIISIMLIYANLIYFGTFGFSILSEVCDTILLGSSKILNFRASYDGEPLYILIILYFVHRKTSCCFGGLINGRITQISYVEALPIHVTSQKFLGITGDNLYRFVTGFMTI